MEFSAAVTDVDTVNKKLAVTIPAEIFSAEYQKALGKFSRQSRIKGFRPGKAPQALVEKLHGERVRAEVSGELIEDSLKKAANENKLSIVGSPQITLESAVLGKPLQYSAEIAIYPQPEVSGYEKLAVEVAPRNVESSEVEDVIQYLRKSKATSKPLTGRTTLAHGDVASALFVVTQEGGEPSKPEPYSFSLGEKNLPDEVEAGILGMAIGETRTITVPGKEEGQKSVSYAVELKELSERILPELDDAFAAQVEPGATTVTELRAKVQARLEAEKKQQTEGDVSAAIIDQLLSKNEFAVPQILIDDEIRQLLVNRGFINPQKMDPKNLPMEIFRKDLGEAAGRRVRAAIIIDRIAEKEQLKLEQGDIEGAVARIANEQGMAPAEVQRILLGSERAMGFMIETIRNKVLTFLRSKATVTTNPALVAKK